MVDKLSKNISSSSFSDKLSTLWHSLSSSEKFLLTILLLFIFVLSYFNFVVKPLNDAIDNKQKESVEMEYSLQWIKDNQDEINDLKSNKANNSDNTNDGNVDLNQPISTIVEYAMNDSIRSYIDRIVPQTNSEIELWFKNVDFNELVLWLNTLQLYKVDTNNLRIDKVLQNANSNSSDNEQEFEEGRVDANLVLVKITDT